MKTHTTEERNEACARVMGGVLSKPRMQYNSPYWKIPGHFTQAGNGDKLYDLLYHRYFDWLVPVARKLGFESIPTDITAAFILVSDKAIESLKEKK